MAFRLTIRLTIRLTSRVPSDVSGPSAVERRALPSVSGASVAGSAATGPIGPGPTAPPGALTRVAPVDPHVSNEPSQPLGRSGLDLFDLLATTDVVAGRQATGPVALEVGLEQARGALLRNLPGDSLAALDSVWQGARRTEEGWYLRSGALTVMGLPGECERVAGEGLAARPESLALRFLQSFARLALGDVGGARAALLPALQRAPHDPLLLVQQSLVMARQGDGRGAEALLSRLSSHDPGHPAIAWGRAALRSLSADVARQQSRLTPSDWPAAVTDRRAGSGHPMPGAVYDADDIMPMATAPRATTPTASTAEIEPAERPAERTPTDVTAAALERFGARVAMRPSAEVAREARLLMRAFSAGGTLATAVNAEQAHAARVVLATFLGVASGEGAETPAPVRAMIEQLVPLLRQGRSDDAQRVVRRHSAQARQPIGRLLESVIRGAMTSESREAARTPEAGLPAVRGESEHGPVVPVRLGLALIEESAASRAAADATPSKRMPTTPALVAGTDAGDVFDAASPRAVANVELSGEGWGAARGAPQDSADWSAGAGVRAVALVCVALAMTALVTGHGAIAIGLAVGAVWLGVRRGGRANEGPLIERSARNRPGDVHETPRQE